MFDRLDAPDKIDVRLRAPLTLRTSSRGAAAAHIRELSKLDPSDVAISDMRGGSQSLDRQFNALDPEQYAQTRNHLDGAVSQLSSFIRHGAISLAEVRDLALDIAGSKGSEKFIQQLAWRDYWQRLYADAPTQIWLDQEDYKTGFRPEDYADRLPDDILNADTPSAAMNQFLTQLFDQGLLHNHARLYLAGYICHFRRVKWQAGAKLFLRHLLDGDPASNNLSWQWVASTFSHKPYYFNLDNLQTFCGADIDTSAENNPEFLGSYETLFDRLFPHIEPSR